MNEWSEVEISLLRELVSRGENPRDVAKRFPSRTRSSVIGKSHRLKLSFRSKRVERKKPAKKEKTVQVNRVSAPISSAVGSYRKDPSPVPPIQQAEDQPPGVARSRHEDWMCQCLFDDGLLCSGRRADRSSWCKYHKSVFTTAPQLRARRPY